MNNLLSIDTQMFTQVDMRLYVSLHSCIKKEDKTETQDRETEKRRHHREEANEGHGKKRDNMEEINLNFSIIQSYNLCSRLLTITIRLHKLIQSYELATSLHCLIEITKFA